MIPNLVDNGRELFRCFVDEVLLDHVQPVFIVHLVSQVFSVLVNLIVDQLQNLRCDPEALACDVLVEGHRRQPAILLLLLLGLEGQQFPVVGHRHVQV